MEIKAGKAALSVKNTRIFDYNFGWNNNGKKKEKKKI